MFKLSDSSKERLSGVDTRLIKIIDLALTISVIDFGIPEDGGYRTADRQKELFDKKISKCDGKKNKSKHQLAMAFDVYAYVDGKASWDKYHLTQVAAAILQSAGMLGYQLAWGGLWKNFVDMPHFQLKA
jgi:peptidoglycan L-alanyl-D-glutamate endopeptidase CwlK